MNTAQNVDSNGCDRQDVGGGAKDLELLRSAFGAALVPIKTDPITRPMIVLGADSLSLDCVDLESPLRPTAPAGVVCGAPCGLLALAFSSEAGLKAFLERNRILSQALVTRNQAGFLVWLQPLNQLPTTCDLDGLKVITSGLVVVFSPYGRLQPQPVYQKGTPSKVDLGELNFEGKAKDFFSDWLIQERYGPPLLQVNSRRKELNVIYWAGRLNQQTGLQYHASREVFQAPVDHKLEIILESQVPNLVIAMLNEAARAPNGIPSYEVRPQRVTAIAAALKVYFSVSVPGQSEIMQQFLSGCLEHRPGAAVFKNDVVLACQAFRKAHGLPPGSENRLRQDLSLAILKHLGVRESHDVKRGGRSQRGFRGLALRAFGGSYGTSSTKPDANHATGSPIPGPPKPETTQSCLANPS